MASKPAKKSVCKKAKAHQKCGRPSIYSGDLADLICERIAAGESLRGICKDDDMPAASTVFRWLAENKAFQEQYAHAREEQAETLVDEIVAIADESAVIVKHEGEDVQLGLDPTAIARNRLRVDARKWVASKLKPKKYGEKVAIGGAGDLPPIQTLDASKLSDATLKELLSVSRTETESG